MTTRARHRAKNEARLRSDVAVDRERGAALLRDGRSSRRSTKAEVARALGVSATTVREWEQNTKTPRVVHVALLADLYEYDRRMLALLFGRNPAQVESVGSPLTLARDITVLTTESTFQHALEHWFRDELVEAVALSAHAAHHLGLEIARTPRNTPVYRPLQAQAYYLEVGYARSFLPHARLLPLAQSRYDRLQEFAAALLDHPGIRTRADLLYGHTLSALGGGVLAVEHLRRARPQYMTADEHIATLGSTIFCAGKLGWVDRVRSANRSLRRALERGRFAYRSSAALAVLGKAGGYGALAHVADGPRRTWAKTSERAFDQAVASDRDLFADRDVPHRLAIQADLVRLDIAHAARSWSLCVDICHHILARVDACRHPRYHQEVTDRLCRYQLRLDHSRRTTVLAVGAAS